LFNLDRNQEEVSLVALLPKVDLFQNNLNSCFLIVHSHFMLAFEHFSFQCLPLIAEEASRLFGSGERAFR
jgi:hypothetical protein